MRSLRELPSVDQVWRKMKRVDALPAELIKNEIRSVLAQRRQDIQQGKPSSEDKSIEELVESRLEALAAVSLRGVVNATGVVLHTNLGRAPLPAFEPILGYSNLEYDLETGKRGKRDDHVSPLLERLLGKSAIAVNNNAAAVYLVLNELAAGSEATVSRGELIEIGDGFRIPDIMACSGAILREVGTTNRTRIEDYERGITERTRLIMRVHPSNFHLTGFAARPTIQELASVGRERGIPVFEDLGSGCLVDLEAQGIAEPLVQASLKTGINVVSFSADKLLGGPQAGIIAGDADLIARIRRNPMYRAFRVDKLILQALQVTLQHLLREDWQRIPTLRMILAPLEEVRARAQRVAAELAGHAAQLWETQSVIGGGSTPDQTLPTYVIALSVPDAAAFEKRLRSGPIPVIARIERDNIVLDLRTVADDEEQILIDAVRAALA